MLLKSDLPFKEAKLISSLVSLKVRLFRTVSVCLLIFDLSTNSIEIMSGQHAKEKKTKLASR